MKAIQSILVICFMVVSSAIFAQPPGGGNQQGGKQGPPPIPSQEQIEKLVQDLANKLTLSGDQKAKVLSLYKAHFADIKQKTAGNARPKREEMDSIKVAFEAKVKSVLNKAQITKYEAFLKNQHPPKQ